MKYNCVCPCTLASLCGVHALCAFLYLKQYTMKILLIVRHASQFITTVTEHIASMNCYIFSGFLGDKVVPLPF